MSGSPHDPLSRKVYLCTLDDSLLSARYSQGAQRRAAQIQGFLRNLQRLANKRLDLSEASEMPTLLVADRSDWTMLFSYPYGFPFVRSARGVVIIVAADYPEQLLHRFDEVLVRGAKAGLSAPGDLREFLDLLIGVEWGHATLHLSGLRTKVKWFDEVLATYLYLLALIETGQGDLSERVVAWARLEVAGSGVSKLPLTAFDYPRAKLPLNTLLWFQGMFTLRAYELLETRAWDLPLSIKTAYAAMKRPDLTPLLLELEPGFEDWLGLFGSDEVP